MTSPRVPRVKRTNDPQLSGRLFLQRKEVAAMLGVTIATLQRWETIGRLDPVRLSGSPTGMVFYRAEDIERLAGGGER